MELFTLLARFAPVRVILSVLLGALAGASYVLLIPIVLSSVASGSFAGGFGIQKIFPFLLVANSKRESALLFGAICLFILIARSLSQALLSRVILDATIQLRVKAYRHIARAPIAELERLGPSKLTAAITMDVQRVIMGATLAPNLLISVVTMAGMLGYLFFLNVNVFWFVMVAMFFGIATYQVPIVIGRKYLRRARVHLDALHESIRGLLHGAKELKLNHARRERYFNEILLVNEEAARNDSKRANVIITIAASYANLLNFLVIGVVAYSFVSYYPIGTETLIAVIMALLYIAGPIGVILGTMPQMAVAAVSLGTINGLFGRLAKEDAEQEIEAPWQWQTARFVDVAYTYDRSGSGFKLGPLDLEISRGEITFIIGGNGSGKSTLCKLISLHYSPSQGEIHFGPVKVDRRTVNSCRQYVAAIFTDYYLFDRLLNHRSLAAEEQALANRYLTELELDKKVTIDDGRFSTIALSDGQKKRLALLVAFLEDRAVYIFDEWAADQDPVFKDVFYHKMLPALRQRNKAVVVISHDDRYFHVADKILVMNDGKLVRTDTSRASSQRTDRGGLRDAAAVP